MAWDEVEAETGTGQDAAGPGQSTTRQANGGSSRRAYQGSPAGEVHTGNYTVPQRHSGMRPKKGAAQPYAFPVGQRQRQGGQQPARAERDRQRGKAHWLLLVGVGMLALLVVWVIGSLGLAWGITRYNDLRYGNPRTYQVDQAVGQGGDSAQHPSHFIAMNLHRQAMVIELIAGNPAKSISYAVPYLISGQGGDLVPVTLDFRDVSGDRRLDMLVVIHLSSGDKTFVFINDGQKFRPPTSKDRIHL